MNGKVGSYNNRNDACKALEPVINFWANCRKEGKPIIFKELIQTIDKGIYINFNYKAYNEYMKMNKDLAIPTELMEKEIGGTRHSILPCYEDGSCDIIMYFIYHD